jgi:hypothetical protein
VGGEERTPNNIMDFIESIEILHQSGVSGTLGKQWLIEKVMASRQALQHRSWAKLLETKQTVFFFVSLSSKTTSQYLRSEKQLFLYLQLLYFKLYISSLPLSFFFLSQNLYSEVSKPTNT